MAELSPAINGTEQRLDLVIRQQAELLDELRALRRLLEPRAPEPAGEVIELREPAKPQRKARKRS